MEASHSLPPLAMRTGVAFFALSLACGCAAGNHAADGRLEPGQAFVLGDGAELAGTIHLDRVRIEEGQTVYVVGDLKLVSEGPVWIAGDLIARDAEELDVLHAPDIAIETESRLSIVGRVLGGDGRSFDGLDPETTVGMNGGDGSSIWMRSPDLFCAGLVQAGAGGNGGTSGNGGSGGSIDTECDPASSNRGYSSAEVESMQARHPYAWVGGRGGDAGRATQLSKDGGGGGSGGHVIHAAYTSRD